MKVLINVFHPNPSASIVNEAWVERLEGEPEVTVHKIHESYPDGRIGVAAGQEALLAHDRVVFQHPFYWYLIPPLTKQWLNQMLAYGWAYGPKGKALGGREWVSAVSTGGPTESYHAGGYNNFSMSKLMKPLQQTANLVHLKFLPTFIFSGAVQATPADVEESAERLVEHVLDPLLGPERRLAALDERMDGEGVKLHVD